jgi:predicted RNA-binding protein associated with RNAse of E/G family
MDAQLFRRVQTNIMNNDQGVYRLQINRCRSGLEKLTPEDCEAALKEINRVCSELNENNALFQKLV